MQANEIQCSLWISITCIFSLLHIWQNYVCFGDFIGKGHFVMLIIKSMHLINLHFWTYLKRGRAIGFHSWAKCFELNFFRRESFVQMVKPGRKIILTSAQFARRFGLNDLLPTPSPACHYFFFNYVFQLSVNHGPRLYSRRKNCHFEAPPFA